MAAIPQDIVENIKKLSEASKVPVQSLVDRLKEIKESDDATIKAIPNDEFKIRFAWTVLAKEMSVTGQEYLIMPISYPRVREQTVKGETIYVGEITGLLQEIQKNESGDEILGNISYASGTLWREAAKNMEKLEIGKVYRASFIPTENSWGISITSSNTGFVGVDNKMMSFKEFFEKEIKPQAPYVKVSDLDLNTSETNTDIKLLEVTVMESDVNERDDGSEYGYYDIADDSIIGRKTQRIFLHPKDVQLMQGSVVVLGGTSTIDKKEQVRWSHQFQMPTEKSAKKEFKVKPVTADVPKEEVEVSLDDSEKKEEPSSPTDTKTETKSEPETDKTGEGDVFEV